VAGKTLSVRWPDVELGDALVLDYGFTDKVITDHFRKAPRTRPVSLRLLVDGQPASEHTLSPESGWRRTRLETTRGRGDVTIEVETTSHADAHLCIDLTARAVRP
jgi:hypothetical protein